MPVISAKHGLNLERLLKVFLSSILDHLIAPTNAGRGGRHLGMIPSDDGNLRLESASWLLFGLLSVSITILHVSMAYGIQVGWWRPTAIPTLSNYVLLLI